MLARAYLSLKEDQQRQQKVAESLKPKELKKLEEEYEQIALQVPQARVDMELADQFFNYAEANYVDVAILNKEVAIKRYEALIRELKQLHIQITSHNT